MVTESRGDRAVIAVTNTGPVVSPEDVQALLEPFRRERGSHPNQGWAWTRLIKAVRAVADAHRAMLSVEPCPDGGLRVRVEFPGQNFAGG